MAISSGTSRVDLATWDPENEATWDSRFAWRTLWITTYNLTLAFCAWYLVSAIAPRLNTIGYDLTKPELYWLVAVPGLAGGFMRMIYMFLPPIVGTRTLVGGSATLLLIPMLGWTFAVRDSSTPYAVLILLAIAAGVGGGAFAGFMPSTSYFFPKRLAGTALGLQAGIGNFGVSLIQFLTPWVVGFGLLGVTALTPQQTRDGQHMWLHNAGLVLVPWVLLGMVLAAVYLRRVPVQANFRQQLDIFSQKHTWVMTAIYLMTFGAFSGFAAQLVGKEKGAGRVPLPEQRIQADRFGQLGQGGTRALLRRFANDRAGAFEIELVGHAAAREHRLDPSDAQLGRFFQNEIEIGFLEQRGAKREIGHILTRAQQLPGHQFDGALVDPGHLRGPFARLVVAQNDGVARRHAHDPRQVIGLIALNQDRRVFAQRFAHEQAGGAARRPGGGGDHRLALSGDGFRTQA